MLLLRVLCLHKIMVWRHITDVVVQKLVRGWLEGLLTDHVDLLVYLTDVHLEFGEVLVVFIDVHANVHQMLVDLRAYSG